MPLSRPLESYRHSWESEENWELREEFLIQYQDDIDENRLLCLAQAYVNVMLLGCKYPDDIMRRISEMAKGLEKGLAIKEAKEKNLKERKARNSAKKQRTEELGTTTGRPNYRGNYNRY